MMRLFSVLLAATFLASPALAVDEFGSRFGNNTPYALDNSFGNALKDTAGFDMDDLNDISPAAGEKEDEEEAEENEDKESSEAEADGASDDENESGSEEGDDESADDDDSSEDEAEADDEESEDDSSE